MYNHTGLQGRLTADPELRYTQQGTAITSFTLPGRLAVDVTGAATPAEASEIIRTEVYKILTELAGYKYDPEVYARRVRDREGWSEQLADDADD